MTYEEKIKNLEDPSFKKIRETAKNELFTKFPNKIIDNIYNQLKRGTILIENHDQLCTYLYSFGNMHQAKLLDSFAKLYKFFLNESFEVVDWGCGQGIGTISLLDYLRSIDRDSSVKHITLIEPSRIALERALLHLTPYSLKDVEIQALPKFFETITSQEIQSNQGLPVLHIFSNILDVVGIDLKKLSQLIDASIQTKTVLLCVGPLNPTNRRLDAFLNYFDKNLLYPFYNFQSTTFGPYARWTYKSLIYGLSANVSVHLIPIKYYPSVSFSAAYELDIVRDLRLQTKGELQKIWTCFEVKAPFDLGASVYDDVHPILAVIHNMIVRGLPTKASPFVEEAFLEAFGKSFSTVELGERSFPLKEQFKTPALLEALKNVLDGKVTTVEKHQLDDIQLFLSPLAIARFQKVLIEALITEKLDITKRNWRILIEEKDVPFGVLAIRDLEQTFRQLSSLSKEYQHFCLPTIEIVVVGQTQFINSPLHKNEKVYSSLPPFLRNQEFDMVVTLSMLERVDAEADSFSKYHAINDCYFNIRNSLHPTIHRTIYTSTLIDYQALVSKSEQGVYSENQATVTHLNYFLQLLFRKEVFRDGQLPILDRAIRNQPVIGLLPTGGGKSLTYQLAAFLQPGVTMIIDPLKSLMKDQFDGLLRNGIDCCDYLNSSQTSQEKEAVSIRVESSSLLFIFISPERLSIKKFRRRLSNMHNFNVYFSYGVIDEVHCVSEWGHDFRFSYLHLGRNLYNFVKPKSGVISLFGLTATASFDVLADVERELSGNGAFELDSDVIVRYENANRLELQYKIEPIKVAFAPNNHFDHTGLLPKHLPKAIKLDDTRTPVKAKGEQLIPLLKRIPSYINDLQQKEVLEEINSKFYERQGIDFNQHEQPELSTSLPYNYYANQPLYPQAGIVFCTHVNNTPLSVHRNHETLKTNLIHDVGSFTGQDNDDDSIKSLEDFRDNKIPVMVATKAFGMGIDKPNVRFTVNMNYSSSLESFVQEAGRAGRDKKMAVSTIMVSDYKLATIKNTYKSDHELFPVLRGHWFHYDDLIKILEAIQLEIPDNELFIATPQHDIVKLHCNHDNNTFQNRTCNEACSLFHSCELKKANDSSRNWMIEQQLINELASQGLKLTRSNFTYLSPDYSSVMYFFNSSFKGDLVEKKYMNMVLNKLLVGVGLDEEGIKVMQTGVLQKLVAAEVGAKLFVSVPYIPEKDIAPDKKDDLTINRESDIEKAIYRMTCIGLIEDYTKDYRHKQFDIVLKREPTGGYFQGLRAFIRRYFTEERTDVEINRAQNNDKIDAKHPEIIQEIYKCLAYLTDFVYDKISEKRKRAIDEMRNFCIEGMATNSTWLEANENLKDYLFYYFNSKYARADYKADNGEEYSLLTDTREGKYSAPWILDKYMQVAIDNEIIGFGTPLDNIKHLYGAVRLIGRSLIDRNPTLDLLEAYCLIYLGFKKNENLRNQFILRYREGFLELYQRMRENPTGFWEIFERYNNLTYFYLIEQQVVSTVEEVQLAVHALELKEITNQYTL